MTQQILPESLNVSEYEIKFNKNERRINEVNHKEYEPVMFVA